MSPFLILLCLYFLQCNGAPAGEASTKKTRKVCFTDVEDQFIIEELAGLPVDKQRNFSKALWEHLADTHREKWLRKTSGFPQERTGQSLRTRFKTAIAHNHLLLNKLEPDHWLQKFRRDLNKPIREHRPPYTQEEKNFIIEELSKPSITNLYSASTWNAIQAKHQEKELSRTPGFENERNAESLCSQMTKMIQRGQLPDQLLEKIKKDKKPSFTTEEKEFLMKELSKSSCTNIFAKSTWDAIQAEHQRKWSAGTPGFENERTTCSLRSHVGKMKEKGLLPDEVLKKIRTYETASGASSSEQPLSE